MISSPAVEVIAYAIIVPSFVIAISEVPAPISTRAIFNSLTLLDTAASIAAIGSNVINPTSNPIFCITL